MVCLKLVGKQHVILVHISLFLVFSVARVFFITIAIFVGLTRFKSNLHFVNLRDFKLLRFVQNRLKILACKGKLYCIWLLRFWNALPLRQRIRCVVLQLLVIIPLSKRQLCHSMLILHNTVLLLVVRSRAASHTQTYWISLAGGSGIPTSDMKSPRKFGSRDWRSGVPEHIKSW